MYYFKFHIGDWVEATNHLEDDEELCYFRLIREYYNSELPLNPDIKYLSRKIRMKGKEDMIKDILKEFFKKTKDGWYNKRCSEEIEEYHSRSEKAKKNGSKGGTTKKNNALALANGKQSEGESLPNHKPLTINQEPLTTNHVNSLSNSNESDSFYFEAFEVLWDKFPRQKPAGKTGGSKGSKKDAYSKWLDLPSDAQEKLNKAVSNYILFLKNNPERPSCALKVFINSKIDEFLEYKESEASEIAKDASSSIWKVISDDGMKRTDQSPQKLLDSVVSLMNAGLTGQEIYTAWERNWLINVQHTVAQSGYQYAPKFETFAQDFAKVRHFVDMSEETFNKEYDQNGYN